MTTLAQQIEAELDRREQQADEARHAGRWSYSRSADATRRYTTARRTLARHGPQTVEIPGPITVCRTCSDLDQDTYRIVAWPCWETLDVAASLGIPTNHTTSEEQQT